MASALGSLRAYCVPLVSEREEVASGRVSAASSVNVNRMGSDGVNQHEVALAPERTDALAGEEAASTFPKSPDVAIRSPSKSPTAPPPVNVIANEDDPALETHHLQVSAPASDKASEGDREIGLEYSSDPAAETWASSLRTSRDLDDNDDLYDLEVAASLAMDTETLRHEVAKYLAREANREQRPQRRAATQRNAAANAAPAVRFSLHLSDGEATEDASAVSPAKPRFLELEAEQQSN